MSKRAEGATRRGVDARRAGYKADEWAPRLKKVVIPTLVLWMFLVAQGVDIVTQLCRLEDSGVDAGLVERGDDGRRKRRYLEWIGAWKGQAWK